MPSVWKWFASDRTYKLMTWLTVKPKMDCSFFKQLNFKEFRRYSNKDYFKYIYMYLNIIRHESFVPSDLVVEHSFFSHGQFILMQRELLPTVLLLQHMPFTKRNSTTTAQWVKWMFTLLGELDEKKICFRGKVIICKMVMNRTDPHHFQKIVQKRVTLTR